MVLVASENLGSKEGCTKSFHQSPDPVLHLQVRQDGRPATTSDVYSSEEKFGTSNVAVDILPKEDHRQTKRAQQSLLLSLILVGNQTGQQRTGQSSAILH